MKARKIALIFDYDDTLVPDSFSFLLNKFGINVKDFWEKDFTRLVSEGYDPPFAYLKLLLDRIGTDKPLKNLSNKDLRSIGAEIEGNFYPGVKSLITDLNKVIADYYAKGLMVKIEYYVISGGLEELIRGNKFISDNFSGIYGCRLGNDDNKDTSPLTTIKRTITFTEKTRYLFEINKGISQSSSDKDPSLVNKDIPPKKRPVPFKNMIYIGDGLTDIPCFSLLMKHEGTPYAVYHHKKQLSDRLRIYNDIIKSKRTYMMMPADYNEDQPMGSAIRLAVQNICSQLQVNELKAAK